jgi:hypothetical protein
MAPPLNAFLNYAEMWNRKTLSYKQWNRSSSTKKYVDRQGIPNIIRTIWNISKASKEMRSVDKCFVQIVWENGEIDAEPDARFRAQ